MIKLKPTESSMLDLCDRPSYLYKRIFSLSFANLIVSPVTLALKSIASLNKGC